MRQQIPAAVLSLWQSGQKIEAIKQLREQNGLGLKEAKDLLETVDEALLAAPGTQGAELSQTEAMAQLQEQLKRLGMQDATQLIKQLNSANPHSSGGSSYTSIKRVTTTVNGKTTTTITASGDHAQAVQALLSGAGAVPDEVQARIEEAVAGGNKLEAITLLREATGLGLGQAKDHIDAAMDGIALDWQTLQRQSVRATATSSMPPGIPAGATSPGEVPRSQGWLWWLLLAAALCLGAWFYFKMP